MRAKALVPCAPAMTSRNRQSLCSAHLLVDEIAAQTWVTTELGTWEQAFEDVKLEKSRTKSLQHA
jgi:hypothetical protein